MSARSVSIEGHTYSLDPNFTVIATQNPSYQTGTYPLPESQLDRFTMSLSLGYPDPNHERQLYASARNAEAQKESQQGLADLPDWKGHVENIHCSPELIAYLQRLVEATRTAEDISLGLSPRAGLQWLAAARAWAFLHDRDHVLPDDIQDIAMPVIKHRCIARHQSDQSATKALDEIMRNTSVYS
jgi:MoxR-like ATPase